MDKNMKHDFTMYPNKIFIETGTLYGYGVIAAFGAGCFESIYSIEKNKDLFKYCHHLFMGYDNIKIIHGSSVDVLPSLLETVNDPCTFWLDAHCSKHEPIPLLDELNIIGRHGIKTHTLLIDDMRLVGKQDHWKQLSIEDIEAAVYKINPDYKITYGCGVAKNDILIAQL